MEKSREILQNKQFRGQIMRIGAMFYPTPVTVRQIKISLQEYGIGTAADIIKHLVYLEGKSYISCESGTIGDNKDDDRIMITSKGIDLVEGTINDDGLYL